MKKTRALFPVLLFVGCGAQGPAGPVGPPGNDGRSGNDAASCTVASDGSGGAVITCPDGTSEVVENGDDGFNVLMRETAFDPNQSCPLGGVNIEAGLDDDRDGVLSDEEVDVVMLSVCNGGSGIDIVGDVVIDEAIDLVSLSGVRRIDGDLIVSSSDIEELDSSALLSVSGSIDVSGSPSLQSIRFLSLQSAGRFVTASGGNGDLLVAAARSLNVVEMPSLVAIDEVRIGSVFDEETIPLEVLSVPRLTTVGQLRIVNTRIGEISLPSLETAGGIFLISARTVQSVDLGGASLLGTLVVNQGNVMSSIIGLENVAEINSLFIQLAAFDAINMPSLSVAGAVHIQGTNLESLGGFPALISVGDFTLISNPSLARLDLDALRTVSSDIEITNNGVLLDCYIDEMVGNLVAFDGELDVGQNGGDGACP